MPKSGDQYDLASLSQHLQQLKSRYSDKTDATILVEPDIPYDDVIRVMDAVKTVHTKRTAPDGREDVQLTALFPDVSIGDAP